jgi:hypothetical protein
LTPKCCRTICRAYTIDCRHHKFYDVEKFENIDRFCDIKCVFYLTTTILLEFFFLNVVCEGKKIKIFNKKKGWKFLKYSHWNLAARETLSKSFSFAQLTITVFLEREISDFHGNLIERCSSSSWDQRVISHSPSSQAHLAGLTCHNFHNLIHQFSIKLLLPSSSHRLFYFHYFYKLLYHHIYCHFIARYFRIWFYNKNTLIVTWCRRESMI